MNWLALLKFFGKNSHPPYSKSELHNTLEATIAARNFGLTPSNDELELLHEILLNGVHKDAGKFRFESESNTVGRIETASGYRINRELELLRLQMSAYPRVTELEKLEWVAFYHVRFEAIHPFMDGNGRSGRVLMERQAQLLGLPNSNICASIESNRSKYYRCLATTHESNDIAPFVNFLSSGFFGKDGPHLQHKIPKFRPLPFKRTSPYESSLPSLNEEFNATQYTGKPQNPWPKQPNLLELDL